MAASTGTRRPLAFVEDTAVAPERLNEYVARKGLGASRWHVLAMLLIPSLAQFIAANWNPTDPKRRLGKRPFRELGIPSRALLLLPLLLPFLRNDTAFVAIIALTLSMDALLLPVQNWTLARNYSAGTRSAWPGRSPRWWRSSAA